MDVGFNSKNKKDRKMYFWPQTIKANLKHQKWCKKKKSELEECGLFGNFPASEYWFFKKCMWYMRLFSQYFREGQSGESSYAKKASVYKPGFIWS